MTIRTYTELCYLETLEDRYDYLSLEGIVGDLTFGSDRWMNQQFYRSREWRMIRDHVIARDMGYDLGSEDVSILGAPYVHHMNPLTKDDLLESTDNLMDPEFLITTSLRTHNAIHYGDKRQLPRPFAERRPGDTAPWREN
jgi:hypothetical protein